MSKPVRFLKAHTVYTSKNAAGVPRGAVDYPEGYEGKIPEAHYTSALEAEGGSAVEDLAAADKPAPAPAAPAPPPPPPAAPVITRDVRVTDPAPQPGA